MENSFFEDMHKVQLETKLPLAVDERVNSVCEPVHGVFSASTICELEMDSSWYWR